MKANLGHLVFGIRTENIAFYRQLFATLGWINIYDDHGMLGVAGAGDISIWFGEAPHKTPNDYDAPGLNHVALGAESIADVDALVGWLREHKVAALFETPRHRPEFARGPGQTYYQVMFESPDRILFEFVYTGPLPA